MSEANLDAVLVTDMVNTRWLTGFTGSSAYTIVTPDKALFITDSRYTIQAANEVQGFDITTFGSPQNWDGILEETLNKHGLKQVGFEPSVSYTAWNSRKEKFPDVEWVAAPAGLITDLRMVKSDEEIASIKKACALADKCMEHVQSRLQIGVAEYDINLEVEFFYRRNGAGVAFEPIVVSGPNSAKPHGKAGERKLQPGDFVTIDCGGRLEGYCSDITRTFVVGEPTDRHKEIYNQVLKAEVECCQLLKDGASGKDIDAHARAVLAERDLAQYFGHGLGHGLGLDVHDPGGMSTRSDTIMKPGMVMTVEPGVYIPDFGGVRIEDDVLVTNGEPEILTHFPKELTVVG